MTAETPPPSKRWLTLALPALSLAVALSGCGGGDGHGGRGGTEPAGPGDIETWAGDGVQGHDGGGHPRLESRFNQPMELAFAPGGAAVVVDWNNHCVRSVGTDGVVSALIGGDFPGDWPCDEPGNPDRCEVPLDGAVPGDELRLNHPMDVAFDDDASFYLAAWHDHKIEHYAADTKDVTVVAGLQKPGPADADNGPAAAARLNFPGSVVIASDGGVLVSDQRNNRIRRIAPDEARTITTVAGSAPDKGGTNADDIPAATALLLLTPTDKAEGADNPPPGGGIALDADGALYIADSARHCIRKVTPGPDGAVNGADGADEIITTVAGTCGTPGYSGDGEAATSATLTHPFDLEIGPDGALYVADSGNDVVRKIDLDDGTIETVAGTGKAGFSGDGAPATEAELRSPYGIAFDAKGNLYIADTANNRIRRVVR